MKNRSHFGLPTQQRLWITCLIVGSCLVLGSKSSLLAQDATAAPKDFVIKGRCLNYNLKATSEGPTVNAKVTLFTHRGLSMEMKQLQQTHTDDEGKFEFAPVIEPSDRRFDGRKYVVKFEAAGRFIRIWQISSNSGLVSFSNKDIPMYPGGAVLSGRVVNEDGDNISGATVERYDLVPAAAIGRPVVTTKTNGLFRLNDLLQAGPKGTGLVEIYLLIRHPEYPPYIASFTAEDFKKGAVRVVLPSGIKLTGKVLNADTKLPVPNAIVNAIGSEHIDMFFFAKTDENGDYRLNLPEGRFQLVLEDESLVAKAQVVECFKGEVLEAEPMLAKPGGWIVGRVIDKRTGKPVSREYRFEEKPDRIMIGCHGPARPADDPLRFSVLAEVDDEGHYRMRVYPGKNYPHLTQAKTERTLFATLKLPPIIVTAGEETTYDFSVEPYKK